MLLARHFAEREGRDLHPDCERCCAECVAGNVGSSVCDPAGAVLAEVSDLASSLAKSLAIMPPELGCAVGSFRRTLMC